MQRDLAASWLLTGAAAGVLVLASMAQAWCGESGAAAETAAAGEIVYVPAQAFQPVTDPSGRFRAHIRGLVPVVVEREGH